MTYIHRLYFKLFLFKTNTISVDYLRPVEFSAPQSED